MSPGDDPPPNPPPAGEPPFEPLSNDIRGGAPNPLEDNSAYGGDPDSTDWDPEATSEAIAEAMKESDRASDPTYHGHHVDPLDDLTKVGRQVDPLEEVGFEPDPYGERHRHVDPLEDVGTTPTPGQAALEQVARDLDADRQDALGDALDARDGAEHAAAAASGGGLPTVVQLGLLGCAVALALLFIWLWFGNDGGDPPRALPSVTAAPSTAAPASSSPPASTAPPTSAAEVPATGGATPQAATDDWCTATEEWFGTTGFGPSDQSDPASVAESQARARPYLERLLPLAPDDATRAAITSILDDPDQTSAYPVVAAYTQQHCDWTSAIDPNG